MRATSEAAPRLFSGAQRRPCSRRQRHNGKTTLKEPRAYRTSGNKTTRQRHTRRWTSEGSEKTLTRWRKDHRTTGTTFSGNSFHDKRWKGKERQVPILGRREVPMDLVTTRRVLGENRSSIQEAVAAWITSHEEDLDPGDVKRPTKTFDLSSRQHLK